MSYKADVYKIFIASPSDTAEERAAVSKSINEWNIIHSENKGIILRDIFAEQNAYADSGKHPQKIINEQLVENADLLVAIFKMKFGSPTDTHESDTAEEIDLAFKMEKHVMLFFYDGTVSMEESNRYRIDIQKINELKAKYSNKTYYHTYNSIENFETKLSRSLPQLVESQFAGHLKNKESRDWDKKIQQIITEPKMFRIDIFSYPNTNGYADDTYDIYEDRAPSPAPSEYSRLYCSKNKSLLDIFQPVSDEVCANKVMSAGGLEDAIMRVALDNTSMPLSNFFLGEGIASKIIGYMIKIGLLQQDRDIIVLTELGRTLSLYLEQRHSEIIS